MTKSELIPKLDGARLSYTEFINHIPNEKWKLFNGIPFSSTSTEERDRLLIALLFSSGIRHFLSSLPIETKKILLIELLKEKSELINYDDDSEIEFETSFDKEAFEVITKLYKNTFKELKER